MRTHSPSLFIFNLAKILHWSLCWTELTNIWLRGILFQGMKSSWHLVSCTVWYYSLFFPFLLHGSHFLLKPPMNICLCRKTQAQPLEMCKMQLSINCDFCLSNLSFSNTFSDASPLKVNVPTQPHGHKAHGRIDVCPRSPPGSFERRAPRDLSV